VGCVNLDTMPPTFSQRAGLVPRAKAIQVKGMDDALRNSLWNVFQMFVLNRIPRTEQYHVRYDFKVFAQGIWFRLRKLPMDSIPSEDYQIERKIRLYFMESEWWEVYDLIDYTARAPVAGVDHDKFVAMVNQILEQECAGWRFIDSHLAAVSSELEVNEIGDALSSTESSDRLVGVHAHLASALNKLSDRTNPDYRGSIRESITALEALVRHITGQSTLGKALGDLDKKGLHLNERFKGGLEKLYAWTNDKENGIRHAFIDAPNVPDFHDAKYMLVTCSAFINFIVGKAGEAGIQLNSHTE
jgi:hypothetical protein